MILGNVPTSSIALRLAADAALVLGPLLAAQGRAVRRNTPQLAGAAGPTAGLVGGPAPALRLLVLGESTAAGVGAATHAEGLSGQLAAALAAQLGRAVAWHAAGQIGATASAVRRQLVPALAPEPVDATLLALGVNDSLRLRNPRRWASDLTALIAALRARVGPAPVFLAAVPPMGRFPALPQPLRAALGLRARLLDATAAALAPRLEAVTHLPLTLPVTREQFCADGFHPGPAGYQQWAELLAGGMVKQLRCTSSRLPTPSW
jgi:lysophospholipase L1-like esterase